MQENADQNNFEYGHFLCNATCIPSAHQITFLFLQLVIPGLIERGGITFIQISLSRLILVAIKSKIPTESSFSQSVRLNLSFNNALSDIMIYVWEYVMYD